MIIKNINHITLACTDIDRSFTFYHDVLGFKPLVKWDKGAYFLVGEFWFCLNLDLRRITNPCYTHYAFSVSHYDFELMQKKISNSIDAQVIKVRYLTEPSLPLKAFFVFKNKNCAN